MRLKVALSILLLSFASLCPAQQHRSRALLVGVAHYPEGSGWRTIHSDNDIRLMKDALSESFYVETLVDNQATYKNIIKALGNLSRETQTGDTVLILFSCHGQQMNQGGEEEEDALDESLIPYDAKLKYSDTYRGENHLRDNELSDCIVKIRKKAGESGYVIVLLDACHSGNSFRGDDSIRDNIRGVYDVFGPSDVTILRRERSINDIVRVEKVAGAADVIYMAACQSDQRNEEIHASDSLWYGSLAYAFTETYRSKGLSDFKFLCESVWNIFQSYPRSIRQCPEFAVSDTGIVLELDNSSAVPDSLLSEDERLVPWVFISILSVVAILIFILLYGRRKWK